MSTLEPRHAVAYHFFNEEATRYEVYAGIRETYDGPLSMATDLMVWNVTKNNVKERMAVTTDDAWSVPGTAKQPPPVKGLPNPMSEWLDAGRWLPGFKAQDRMLDEYGKEHGLEELDWRPGMYKKLEKNQ
jgi:ribonuclease Z